jgi:hypothetical protein
MRNPDVVVFVGSSLLERDRTLLPTWYKPPAQQGDVIEAVEAARPSAIAIIDGLFQETPAVRHREILWALYRGVQVFGSSSMGALRAAELAPQGMVGVGLIYHWYRSSALAGDDEVAQVLGPAELGFQPLSEALIEMRLTFRRAQRAGIISADLRRELEACAKGLFYRDRSFERVFALARGAASSEWQQCLDRLAAWLPDNRVQQKRRDALSLMQILAAGQWRRPQEWRTGSRDLITGAWLHDLEQSGLAHLLHTRF